MSVETHGRADLAMARCGLLARLTEVAGETTRSFLSQPMHEVHRHVRGWMEAAGMVVRIDAAGNIRGLYAAAAADAPRLVAGSHLDTVPNAGMFDGVLGVMLGLAVIEELRGRRLPFAIEVIGFSDEEGVRFGTPFLGSLAVVGRLDRETLARTDQGGVSIAEAIREFGLDPDELGDAVLDARTFGYLEFHIEQGPVLDAADRGLAAVEAIAGQTRLQLVFTGQANHAGTTPMRSRHDALAAAAHWIVEVEQYGLNHDGLVATVGRITAHPGVVNVIPGEVTISLDVRHRSDEVRDMAVDALLERAEAGASLRGIAFAATKLYEQAAVVMDSALVEILEAAAERAGYSAGRITSGAGHDAMIVGERVPAVMLFLRSPGGLSHHPDETVRSDDVAAALATAMEFLSGLEVARMAAVG